jgi:TolB-like protein/class 3 adenylate cyclase
MDMERTEMAVVRRLAAILAADVAGYSRLMAADEEGTLARLLSHRRALVDPKITEHHGRIVKSTGDGLLVEFPSAVEAVRCAVEVQRGMAERNAVVPIGERVEFRVGINLGDVIVEDDDIYGDGVNVAARLEGLAEPGGVFISNIVYEEVRDRLPFDFDDIGEQRVKNIARLVRVYRVPINDNLAAGALRPARDKPSLAVLPFQNMSGDPEQDYFADGIVEEITTAIARLPWLFVIARNSSFTYKGRAVDVRQVARELGARYVLEGSVRKAANRVRLTGQLIDTATAAHIWADRFDGALDDIFELQDQMASHVVGAIEPRLRLSEIERASCKPTERLDAYDLYLRALAQCQRFTGEGMREAIVFLERALAIDPFYAPAAAMIGRCRFFQFIQGWGSLSDAEIVDVVLLARQALEAGKDDPETLSVAAFTLSIFAGDHNTATAIVQQALRLNPNSVQAWMTSGWTSAHLDKPELAIEALQRAMRLSPLDPLGYLFAAGLAFAHSVARRYEEAIEWADRSLQQQPRFVIPMRLKTALWAHLDRLDQAREWLGRLLELQPGLTISKYKRAARVWFSPEFLAWYLAGLRKAGLPED